LILINFFEISYLKTGNKRQQLAYEELSDLKIFEILQKHQPVLAGTVPIEIDIQNSDLDIICECSDHQSFIDLLHVHYSGKPDYSVNQKTIRGIKSTIIRFNAKLFKIEIFGQNKPVIEQYAYRHMIIEYKILKKNDDHFRNEIINLKRKGLSTEEAFAKRLDLKGDPYEELLNYTV